MRTPEEVAHAVEEAREGVRSAWMDHSKRDAAERSAVAGVIEAYRDEVLAHAAAEQGDAEQPSGERGDAVRVTLHVKEEVSHSIGVTVPEELLGSMREAGVDVRDAQAVTRWLAANLDADVDSLVGGRIGVATEVAVTERVLEGVSPAP